MSITQRVRSTVYGVLHGLLLIGYPVLANAAVVTQRTPSICYQGETSQLLCYEAPNGTPQDVKVADITYIATYLRKYGRQNPRQPGFFTMKAADAADCAEWSLYTRGTAAALAKHLDTTDDTSVLFEDIATTLDGGERATDDLKAKAIIGCLTNGGSLGVLVNSSNPAYSSDTYTSSGYTTKGLLIKIVHSSES